MDNYFYNVTSIISNIIVFITLFGGFFVLKSSIGQATSTAQQRTREAMSNELGTLRSRIDDLKAISQVEYSQKSTYSAFPTGIEEHKSRRRAPCGVQACRRARNRRQRKNAHKNAHQNAHKNAHQRLDRIGGNRLYFFLCYCKSSSQAR